MSSHGNLVTDGSFFYWQSDTAIKSCLYGPEERSPVPAAVPRMKAAILGILGVPTPR